MAVSHIKTFVLLAFFIILFSLNSYAVGNYSVLQPDDKYKRYDKILADQIYIRFANEKCSMLEIMSFLEKHDLKITKRLINPDNSMTYSKRKKESLPKKTQRNYDRIIIEENKLLRTFMIDISDSEYRIPEVLCSKLQSECGIVEIAEPVYIYQPSGEFIPDDPLLDLQPMHEAIKSYEAWDIYQGTPEVIIGISDTGVLQVHEDLVNSLWINQAEIPENEIDDDGNGYIDDYNGYNFAYARDNTKPGNTYSTNPHGTGTAGLASATVNNGLGVAGTGFKTKMFPFKTTIDNTNSIYFGYESILYSALNDIDIVNCSWGGHSYSCVNENIIDYCIARNLIIVTGAGNHYSTKPFYPAAYTGVMGVGVTDPQDTIIPMTARGYYVDIMAPGHESWTTANDSTYGSFCCTSGASPIAAGMLALICGLHPDLTNLQVIEFAKNCTDDILDNNPEHYKDFIPGRMNMFKAVTEDPFSKPGIDVVSYDFVKKGEQVRSRFLPGDTIICYLKLHNYLGDANNLSFDLRMLEDSTNSIEIIDGKRFFQKVESGEDFELSIEIVLLKPNTDQLLLRFDIDCDECENDYVMIPFFPSSDYINIFHNNISISLADNGRIGYSNPPFNSQGLGFSFNSSCSYLWEAGLICTENEEKVVSQVRNVDTLPQNDFAIINPFLSPDPDRMLITDGNAPDDRMIGLEISSRYSLPDNNSLPCVRLDFEIKNVSGRDLNDLAFAYFFDWDIGVAGDSNRAAVRLFDISWMNSNNTSAAITYHEGNYPAVGSIAFAKDAQFSVSPIAASLENKITFRSYMGFTDDEKIEYLNSGTGLTTDHVGDIAVINGMKFPGRFQNYETRNFSMCICAAGDNEKINDILILCADETINKTAEKEYSNICIYPRPATDKVNIKLNDLPSGEYNLRVTDLLGNIIFKERFLLNTASENIIPINTFSFPSNIYLLNISSNSFSYTDVIIIIH